MNKLEKEHFKVIDDNIGAFQLCEDSDPIIISGKETAATSCASITKEYAEKFGEWIDDHLYGRFKGEWTDCTGDSVIAKTTSELWDIFLNGLNEK
jgi:hypothetical protein